MLRTSVWKLGNYRSVVTKSGACIWYSKHFHGYVLVVCMAQQLQIVFFSYDYRCAMLKPEEKTGSTCIQTYKLAKEFSADAKMSVPGTKLFGGHLLGVGDGKRCRFHSWENLAPTGISIAQPLDIIWEDEERFFAVYEFEIQLSETKASKEISEVQRIHSEGAIIGTLNTEDILYYHTDRELHAFVKEMKVSVLMGSKKLPTEAGLGLIQSIVKVPESSISYKHLAHCYIAKLY